MMELSRTIIISTEIDEKIAGDVVAHLNDINAFDEERGAAISSLGGTYKPEPIEMIINSGGGSVTDGFAIIAAMEMSETPIITYGLGLVASMALAIFVAGDVRIAHRFTRYMYHSIAYGAIGHIKEHEDATKEADLLQRMYNSLFLDRTKLTNEAMADIREKKSNFFFSGKEAVKLGIADEVILKPDKKFKPLTEEQEAEIEKIIKAAQEEIEKL